jgi:hypothetical protein
MKGAQQFIAGSAFFERHVPPGTLETISSGFKCDFRSTNGRRSSRSGRIFLNNVDPTLKRGTTFTRSLRDCPGR